MDVVCGQVPTAVLFHLPASPAVLPQDTALATLLGMGWEASVGLEHSFWFPGQLCAAVATGMGWCAIVHPKCILSLQQGVSRSWGAWCMRVFEVLWLEVAFQFLWCSAKCVHLCYQGHICLSTAC